MQPGPPRGPSPLGTFPALSISTFIKILNVVGGVAWGSRLTRVLLPRVFWRKNRFSLSPLIAFSQIPSLRAD